MTAQWFNFDAVFDGSKLHQSAAVRIDGGTVTELGPHRKSGTMCQGTLTPGFVDLQVNGGGGVLFNNAPTEEGLDQIIKAHRSFGTTSILPTLITDSADVMQRATDAVIGSETAIGLHFEGPHIAVAKRGTHAAEHIRPFDDHTLGLVRTLRDAGKIAKVTLAPEVVTPSDIERLAKEGAIISLGHTDATAEQIGNAVAAGATCGTHLFNAMSQMTGREPSAVGGILDAGLHFGVICDGHHVSNTMLRLALRASPNRGYLVSDAMATVGGPDSFDLYGQTITVRAGRLINSDGNLAGAHLTQLQGLAHLVQRVGIPFETALQMAIAIPSEVIGRPELTQLIGCKTSDVLVLPSTLSEMHFLNEILG